MKLIVHLIYLLSKQYLQTDSVGHLPREVSRATKFLIDRVARISLVLSSRSYRRSPLVQGGLEISCHVTVKLPETIKNHLMMD